MSSWLSLAVLGGLVGLDATSFPQVMISRPVVAGALTGAVFGRPIEGVTIGFIVEAFSLLVLPVGAARYPESGTAAVAATGAYLAAVPPGIHAGAIVLALAFALAWERVAGASVVLLRRANGRILTTGQTDAQYVEHRHLAALSLDFVRGAAVTVAGGLLGYGVLALAGPYWRLEGGVTAAALAILAAGMVGTAVPLFGGLRSRRVALATGLAIGLAAALLLP